MENGKNKKSLHKSLGIIVGAIAALWLIITIVLHIFVNSQSFTDKIVKMAETYIDADLSIESINASVFEKFPNISIHIDKLSLTYPHEKFARYDQIGLAHSIRESGRGNTADTLAYFDKFSISLNYLSLLRARIRFPEASLNGVRIFAKQYDKQTNNWDIFKLESEDDSSSISLPNIIINKIALDGNPYVSFASPSDTLYASVDMASAGAEGRIDINSLWKSNIHLHLDSLYASARLPYDTLAFRLHNFNLDEKNEIYNFQAIADAYLMSPSLGKFDIPTDISGSINFPQENLNEISLRDFIASVGTLNMQGGGDALMGRDSTYLRAELSIHDCPVQQSLHSYGTGILPELKNLRTNARADLTAMVDGWYIPAKQALPQLIAELVIPETTIRYEGFEHSGKIAADIEAITDQYGNLEIDVQQLKGELAGLRLQANGFAEDVLSSDPLIGIELSANASLDTLDSMLPEGMSAEGQIQAMLNGYILLSDMSLYNFSRADLDGYIKSDRISFTDESADIYAYIDSTSIKIEKAGKDSLLGAELLGIKGQIDSLFVSMGKSTFFRGKNVNMIAQNASDIVNEQLGKEIHPIVGSIGADRFAMIGEDSLFVGLQTTKNNFKFSNIDEEGFHRPILAIRSDNQGISLRQGTTRAGLNNLSINASAIKRNPGQTQGKIRKQFLDSLQKRYPGIHRDSLITHIVRGSENTGIPDFLLSDDFKKNDIDFRFDDSFTKYIKEWAFNGAMQIDSGILLTPQFPLKNTVANVKGDFTNNRITLDNLSLYSGESDLSINGNITNIGRAMFQNGVLNLELNIASEKIKTDELLNAYNAGQQYSNTVSQDVLDEDLTDEEYLSELITEEHIPDSTQALIVIPANVNAKISLAGNEIDYSQLKIDWFESDILMKERTLQITNTVATSNMGDIYLEGFYTTRTKSDISAGFDLNMASITADKVIALFPAVDSIMPVIKSFKGNLDCELAATTQLDTNMNFILPTINGVLNIKGTNLSIEDNQAMDKLARVLMFKERKMGKIEDMSVQGLVSNNMIEVFPFVMRVDRYTLAMNGLQNFDQSFNYHVSVLRSPIPFRFGINLSGNFDDWKYKIGKAKYKNANVPVFTKELKDMQMNLVSSIHNIFTKGVEFVLRQNTNSVESIDKAKNEAGYDGEADSEDLEAEEMEELNRLISENEETENSESEVNDSETVNIEIESEIESKSETEHDNH